MSHDFTQHEPFNFMISVEGLPKNIKTLKVHKNKTNKNLVLFKTQNKVGYRSCYTTNILSLCAETNKASVKGLNLFFV